MIRDFFWPADCAKIDRVMAADLIFPVVWQHFSVAFAVIPAGKIKVVKVQVNAKFSGGGIQHPQALGHHLFADAVASNHGDSFCAH